MIMQVINTNVGALFAAAALNKSASALQTAQQRLSSGLRINSVADDATGLVTATTDDSLVRGTNIAVRNANNAVSNAQTLDGYASQVVANLQRLYEIAVQTGGASNSEATALTAENARIATLANTNTLIGKAVTVDGSGGTYTALSASLTSPAATSATGILTDITNITAIRTSYGSDIATFSSAVATMQTTSVNASASYSRIMDTDYAAETTNMTRNNILQQAGMAVLAQANQTPNQVLTLLR
jgi:flagellin